MTFKLELDRDTRPGSLIQGFDASFDVTPNRSVEARGRTSCEAV